MQEMDFGSDYSKLEGFYMQSLIQLLHRITHKGGKLSKKQGYLVWQEVFDNGVKMDNNTIVHVWKDERPTWPEEMGHVTKAGYRAILSSCWYLNYIKYGNDWKSVSG